MTDYGSFSREDREERRERLAREERERKERERIRVDEEFEKEVMLSKRPTCSENSNLVQYTKHLKAVRTALKAAAADGFCLDEIIDGLKELGDS